MLKRKDSTSLFRPVHPDDLAAILDIQRQCYPPSMQESPDIIRARIAAAGRTSWVAVLEEVVVGYLFAYPSMFGAITSLNAPFSPAHCADTLYLHDLAIAQRSAGARIGTRFVRLADHVAAAMAVRYSTLVAVQDSQAYWKKMGFRPVRKLTPQQQEVLATYPEPACYMFKPHRAEAARA